MDRSCELCSKPARMYCDSDEARLCWDCDEKVHGANFLVAKHSRTLLCHVCQSPTPWKASGTKLSPSISVCQACFHTFKQPQILNPTATSTVANAVDEEGGGDETDQSSGMDDGGDDDSDTESLTESTDDDEEEEEDEIEEEDGENQVVPWASCPSPSVSSAPPLATSSSSSEEGSFSAARKDGLKRSWGSRIPDSDDEDVCCSSQADSASVRAAGKTARVEEHPEWRRRRVEFVGSLMGIRGSTAGGGGEEHDRSASMIIRRITELKAEMQLD